MPRSNGFFRVEIPMLKIAHELGAVPMAAYLVQASGTGKDNRSTRWSSNVVGKCVGCRSRTARTYINALINAGLIRQLRGGRYPAYELVTFREYCLASAESEANKNRRDLLSIQEPTEALKGKRLKTAREIVSLGLLDEIEPGVFDRREPLRAWLPNTLVDGAVNEEPPIKRLAKAGLADQLYLLAALYALQILPEFGGIDPALIWHEYTAELLQDVGEWAFWEFLDKKFMRIAAEACHDPVLGNLFEESGEGWEPFWDAFRGLLQACLIEAVPTLFEGDPKSAEVMHPLDGNLLETAQAAADAMLFESRKRHTEGILIPVARNISAPQVAGVFRLRYRPHTAMTKAWVAKEHDRERWTQLYSSLFDLADEEVGKRNGL